MPSLLRKILFFLLGSITFTGTPVIPWLVAGIPDYFANPYRIGFTGMMIFLTLLVVIFVPGSVRDPGEGQKLVTRQKRAITYLQILSLLIMILPSLSDRNGFMVLPWETSIRLLGLILTFFGYLLMNWSMLALGRQFSINVTIQKDHQLITGGLYRFIRHPRYLGILTFYTGIVLVYRSAGSLTLVVLTAAVLLWRIHDEEKLLGAEFPEQMAAYKKRSWRLIPLVF